MTQENIVFIVLALVVGYVIYSVIKNFRSKNGSKCSGCSGCSAKEEISKAVKDKESCCKINQ